VNVHGQLCVQHSPSCTQRGIADRVIFAVLMTEFDVKEFEAGAYQTG
jgi:hypothetical protein